MNWLLAESYPYEVEEIPDPSVAIKATLHTIYDNKILAKYRQLRLLKTYFIFTHPDEDLSKKACDESKALMDEYPEYFL